MSRVDPVPNARLSVPMRPLGQHGWWVGEPTDADIDHAIEAQEVYDRAGVPNLWDPPKGMDWRWDGRLAEAGFQRWADDVGLPVEWHGGLDTPDFTVFGQRVGCKATHIPRGFRPDYDVKVLGNVLRDHQREGLLAFFAWESTPGRLLFLGAISRKRYLQLSKPFDVGDRLPRSGMLVGTPLHTIQTRQLTLKPDALLQVLREPPVPIRSEAAAT